MALVIECGVVAGLKPGVIRFVEPMSLKTKMAAVSPDLQLRVFEKCRTSAICHSERSEESYIIDRTAPD